MKNKSITLIGINYYPEDTAIGLYSTQMAQYLSQKGYDVTVITGFPYYPEWKLNEQYTRRPTYFFEEINNIKIYRYKQYIPKSPNFKTRTLHLLDFTFGSIVNVFKIKKSDLVLSVVPFTSSIFLGNLIVWKTGSKHWIHIQDFEVDAILDSGIASNDKGFKKHLFKILFGIERKLFNSADMISTISYAMIDKLKRKTDRPAYYFPNWIDETDIDPSRATIHPYMLGEKFFKVLYSGNIGAKQDWDFFIKVLEHFENQKDIVFIVVGAGAKKDWLVSQTKRFHNIKHYMPVEYNQLSDLLCSADLHILFQKNDIVDAVMPSKLLGMMGSMKPSVVTGNKSSEVATVFEKSEGGYFFDSCDLKGVVDAIECLKNDIDMSKRMGKNARSYIVENFSKKKVLSDFEKNVYKIIHEK
jgi:colanic acid biosynthesis glycosyl transferase WcaI